MELDFRRVGVLTNASHVVVHTDATLVHLFGVHSILGVQVLHLARGEHAVDAPVELHLGSEAVQEGDALLFAGKLEQVGAFAHDRRATSL